MTSASCTVTVRVDDATVSFEKPIPDPFARTTVVVGWVDLLRALLRRRHLKVEVIIGGNQEALRRYFSEAPVTLEEGPVSPA